MSLNPSESKGLKDLKDSIEKGSRSNANRQLPDLKSHVHLKSQNALKDQHHVMQS